MSDLLCRPGRRWRCRSRFISSSPSSGSRCPCSWSSRSVAGNGRAIPVYLDLAKRWARGTAILFAVGAVSGTVLSFELGLLWPRFMALAGPVIGMPFSSRGSPSSRRRRPATRRRGRTATGSIFSSTPSRPRMRVAFGASWMPAPTSAKLFERSTSVTAPPRRARHSAPRAPDAAPHDQRLGKYV